MKRTLGRKGRIEELDGLRGVAILLVLSFHFINNQLLHTTNPVGRFLAAVTGFGWVGVDLFFVLSGFLIGSILIRNKLSKNYFSTFYARRFLRIVPNYYLLLIIFALIQLIPYFKDSYLLSGNKLVPLFHYFLMIQNITMASINNMGNGSLSVSWSIGIEEQFYLLFPLIVYFLTSRRVVFVLLLLIVIAPVIRFFVQHWIPNYVLLPTRMDALSMGFLIAYVYQSPQFAARAHAYHTVVLIAMGMVVIISALMYLKLGDLGALRHTLFGFFFSGALFLALAKMPFYSRVLRDRVLQWIGTISYPLYLFHYLILALFHHVIGNKAGVILATPSDLAVSLAALVCSFSFAWIVYKGIESPLVELGKKISY